nr:hypothetical protein [Tanacetum cinerariifolium]
APIEDQPIPDDASPTTLSPSYVADLDPKEDPMEDLAEYPADERDDDDDDEEEEGEDEEKAAMIRLKAASPLPLPAPSPPLLVSCTTHRDDLPKADMPLRKRAHFTAPTGSHDSGTGSRRTERAALEHTYSDFLKFQPLNFKATKGVISLTQWFEKMKSVFHISNCTIACQIKFATCTLLGSALTWWNSHVKTIGHDAAYGMP